MTTTLYDHWRDVPQKAWRWPNFSPAEIACRGTGKLLVNEPALDKLQALRDRLGKPLIVRSAYRSPEHNRAVGGATRSKHMDGAAGVEVAQQVLAETQSAVLPLVPYLDTLRWVFIAVALVGIAVAIYARFDDWKRGRR